MLTTAGALFLSILANLLTPYVRDILHVKNQPEEDTGGSQTVCQNSPDDPRQKNRERAKTISYELYVFFINYFFVFASICLPYQLLVLSHPSGVAFNIEKYTRIALNITQSKTEIFYDILAVSVILYFITLYNSRRIANIVASIMNKFVVVNRVRYLAYLTLSTFAICILYGSLFMYLFNITDSVVGGLVLIFSVFAFMFLYDRY